MVRHRFFMTDFVRVGTSSVYKGSIVDAMGNSKEEALKKALTVLPEGESYFAHAEWMKSDSEPTIFIP